MSEAPQSPKAIVIVVDQMRADCLSVLGHACIRTPNLDRLAKRGTLFENHFSQCTPCGPSRASLLTGRYMKHHGSYANAVPILGTADNIAKEMRHLGVAANLFGYTDTAPDPRTISPNDPEAGTYCSVLPGFDPICRMESDRMLPWRADLKRKGYDIPDTAKALMLPVQPDRSGDPAGMRAPPVYSAQDSDTAFLFDQLIGHLSVAPDQPEFFLVTPYRPHPPFVAPEPFNGMYHVAGLPPVQRPLSVRDEAAVHPFLSLLHASIAGAGRSLTGHEVDLHQDLDHIDHIRAVYYGLISEIDFHVGRLLDYLETSGQADNTLVIFTSDHAEMLGDHWLFGKRGFFDATVQVPLIISNPRADRAGHSVTAFTEHVDLLPTLVEWFGGSAKSDADGRSLLPTVNGPVPENWRDHVFWEYNFLELTTPDWRTEHAQSEADCTLSVLRDDRFKLVDFPNFPPLLFDLQNDPVESRDVSRDPEFETNMASYTKKLHDFSCSTSTALHEAL